MRESTDFIKITFNTEFFLNYIPVKMKSQEKILKNTIIFPPDPSIEYKSTAPDRAYCIIRGSQAFILLSQKRMQTTAVAATSTVAATATTAAVIIFLPSS